LTTEQQAHVPAVMAKGASANGFHEDVWRSRRLAVTIKQEFGVSYHPDHCGYLARKLGYSMRNLVDRATQPNEEAIGCWKAQRCPAEKKPSKNTAPKSLSMMLAFICCRWWCGRILYEVTLRCCVSGQLATISARSETSLNTGGSFCRCTCWPIALTTWDSFYACWWARSQLSCLAFGMDHPSAGQT